MDFDAQANLDRLIGAIQEDLETQQTAATQYAQYLSEYRAVDQALATLPLETSYDAFIPLGSLAFMPGRLVHTNEVLILLGDNWFVERSASQARAMAQRRIQYVQDNLDKVQAHIQALTQRLHLTTGLNQMHTEQFNEDGDPIVDIVERVDDHPNSDLVRQRPLPCSTNAPSEPFVRPNIVEKPPEQFDDARRALLATLDKFEQMELLDQEGLTDSANTSHPASASSQHASLTDANQETPAIVTDVRPKTPTTPGGRPLKSSLKSPLTPPPSTRKSVNFDDSRNQIYEDTRTFPDPIQERIDASQLSLNPKSRARIVLLPPSESLSPPTASADKGQTTNESGPAGTSTMYRRMQMHQAQATAAGDLEITKLPNAQPAMQSFKVTPAAMKPEPNRRPSSERPVMGMVKEHPSTATGATASSSTAADMPTSDEEKLDQELLAREVSQLYHQRRVAMTAQRGDLHSPATTKPKESTKRVSRFKAARMAHSPDT
ncbi:hypothetical protein H4R35_000953 [Dimargaris xerosporica]|nr:hypothetical protein H4R35_000953 [Dimargaris xerosporica]